LINKDWIKKWKEFSNYQEVKKYLLTSLSNERAKPDIKPKSNKHPGPINNKVLLLQQESFFNDLTASQENYVLDKRVKTDKDKSDIKIVNKAIWSFFYNRYGGGPEIIRNYYIFNDKSCKFSTTSKILELRFLKLRLHILCTRETLDKEFVEQIEVDSLYVSRKKTVLELKEKIIRSLNVLSLHFLPSELNLENIRIWMTSQPDITEAKQLLLNNMDKISYSKVLINSDHFTFLDGMIHFLTYYIT